MTTGKNMASDLFAIDANVILRHVLADNEELSPKAKAIFAAVEEGRCSVLCESVTLAEVIWVLGSVYKLAPARISTELSQMVALPGFRMPNKQRYINALQLYATTVPHFGDACACAAAMEECGGRLLSFDQKLSKVEGIERAEDFR